MKFFKRKEHIFLEFKFFCKTCDIFFYRNRVDRNRCPICKRKCEVYDVREVEYEQRENNTN